MSEDVVVCEVCGSSNVEEMVWRDANSHEITNTDTDTYEDDCWCNACGQHRNLIELEDYYDNILRYWGAVADKNGIKGGITIDVAKKAEELLRGMDLYYMDVGYDNEDSVKSLKQALGESNADAAVELFEKWSEVEWAKPQALQTPDCSWSFLERYGTKVPKWFQEKEKSWLSADGIPPAEEIDWDALAAAKWRGFPIGEEIKAPEQLTGSVPEVRGSCRTYSDAAGDGLMFTRAARILGVDFGSSCKLTNFNGALPTSRLVDPGGLSDWINSPLSTIHDKRS